MKRPSPEAATALLHALAACLGAAPYKVEALACRDWASATFAGTRHKLTLSIAAEAAASFLDGIEEAEFSLVGHILADIAIVSAAPDGEVMRVALEALTVEDD